MASSISQAANAINQPIGQHGKTHGVSMGSISQRDIWLFMAAVQQCRKGM